MKPIIFLDIDGVLNHSGTTHRIDMQGEDTAHGVMGMSPECVKVLDELVERTGAEIVVSSTWRKFFTLGQIGRILKRQGFTQHRSVIDKTPSGGPVRGHEIQAWLDAHGNPSPFVILDDDTDMAHLLHRLVRTDPYSGGLTRETADRAAGMLRGSP